MKNFKNLRVPIFLLVALFATSCSKDTQTVPPDAATYSQDVVTSWLALQVKLVQTTTALPALPPRRFAYTGIALYESIVPGLTGYKSIASQLNGLPTLPTITPNVTYYWSASANAALAAMARNFYPTTSAANLASIDSLEAANSAIYKTASTTEELSRSVDFGKKIAAAVFDWSKTDGNDDATPYTVPTGVGLWVPTPPALVASPVLPNWGKCRQIVIGSDAGADQGASNAYSTDPSSAYYAQAKEVFDISQNLTAEQKAIALFWADNPDGKSFSAAHWLNILNQVLAIQKPKLDLAAVAYAQLGITMAEANISLFKAKYKYNGLRPITYIRSVMNQPTWNSLITTPAHQEYPSGHATVSGSAAQTLTLLFGANYKFTDNSYNFLGFTPRTYNSFEEAAIEAGNSRVYAGIHYRKSCDVSQLQGKAIALNVSNKVKFK